MWNGKKKAITFSYDDGVTQDVRLIALFNKYGLKATFNLNSELLGLDGALVRNGKNVTHIKNAPEDVKKIYEGHEVAVHTLTHPFLPDIGDEKEIIRQVEEDRKNLSALVGYEVVGMAYPCGGKNNDDRTARIIKEHTGVKYARALETNGSFSLQENLYRFQGSCYHHAQWDRMHALADEFLERESDEPMLFYIWGHAYEFDIYPERWEAFEAFLKKLSGRSDVFYGTNKECLLG